MKLQIDTVAKTIKLEQSAKITDILSTIKKLLPNDWKDYSLEAVQTIFDWNYPIYTPTPISFPNWPPQVLYNTDHTICNVELINN